MAVALNGSSQYLLSTLQWNMPTSNGDFTISAWIKPAANPAGVRKDILARYSNSTGGQWGGFGWGLYDLSNAQFIHYAAPSPEESRTVNTISTSNWTHIVMKRTGGVTYMYTNGADQTGGSGEPGTYLPITNAGLMIGANGNASGSYGSHFNGSIAEVAIWESALSDTVIKTVLYTGSQAGKAANHPDVGTTPNYYWALDTDGTAVVGGVNMTPNGSPTFTTHATAGLTITQSAPVTITSVNDTSLNDAQAGITITGAGFKATQSTGKVYICPTDDVSDVNRVEQTVAGWGDTSINITAVRGALSHSTNLYLFVVNSDSDSNASGYVVQFNSNKKLKVLVHSSAAGATGVKGVVFAAPSVGTIAGAEIGEFSGKSFEAGLESGQAVLKVPVGDFNGSSLTTSDTPVVLVRNDTNTTGIINATIIEE